MHVSFLRERTVKLWGLSRLNSGGIVSVQTSHRTLLAFVNWMYRGDIEYESNHLKVRYEEHQERSRKARLTRAIDIMFRTTQLESEFAASESPLAEARLVSGDLEQEKSKKLLREGEEEGASEGSRTVRTWHGAGQPFLRCWSDSYLLD